MFGTSVLVENGISGIDGVNNVVDERAVFHGNLCPESPLRFRGSTGHQHSCQRCLLRHLVHHAPS